MKERRCLVSSEKILFFAFGHGKAKQRRYSKTKLSKTETNNLPCRGSNSWASVVFAALLPQTLGC